MKRILCACLILGCSGRPNVAPGSLVVTPNPATFRAIERGETEVLQTLFLKNRSAGVLQIQTIDLTELDENKELSVVDMFQWENVTLAPNEERPLQILWTPTDTQVDQGRVELSIAGQLPLAVPIISPEVPSFVQVTTTPEGVSTEGQYSLVLNGAPLGGRQAAWLNVSAQSLAGLTLSRLCFLDESGECQLETENGYALCAGRVTQPDGCDRPDVPTVLQQNDRIQATIFFTAQIDSDELFSARLLVETNDRDFPQYVVDLSATVCRSEMGAGTCGTCGNLQIDPGEECDDGNRNSEDDCRNDCLLPTCADPPDSDGDGLSDRCDDRPNVADFSSAGRVRLVGGRNLSDQHTQQGGASSGRVNSTNEQFKHRARVLQ